VETKKDGSERDNNAHHGARYFQTNQNFVKKNLSKAIFKGVNVKFADFSSADFQEADFSWAVPILL